VLLGGAGNVANGMIVNAMCMFPVGRASYSFPGGMALIGEGLLIFGSIWPGCGFKCTSGFVSWVNKFYCKFIICNRTSRGLWCLDLWGRDIGFV